MRFHPRGVAPIMPRDSFIEPPGEETNSASWRSAAKAPDAQHDPNATTVGRDVGQTAFTAAVKSGRGRAARWTSATDVRNARADPHFVDMSHITKPKMRREHPAIARNLAHRQILQLQHVPELAPATKVHRN